MWQAVGPTARWQRTRDAPLPTLRHLHDAGKDGALAAVEAVEAGKG